MSIEIARYQFHSWSRRGISANINDTDDLGAGTVHTKERATVSVTLKANADEVKKDFSLIGPGDIIGVNRDMIIRTEPLNWITDFEPNYLTFIEFYDEDFPWRYTPAKPDGEKLRPWLALVVLKEDEFERTKRQLPLPSINIINKSAMPAAAETWLWAHVHSNVDIPDEELSDYESFLESLNTATKKDPDGLFSRLMCPRHLSENTGYYAFLIPAFETGRLAGLEQPTDTVDAQQPAWQADGTCGEMPVYYEWFFHTGNNADFESLVKLLEPRAMDSRVGIRAMDASQPGFVKANGSGPLSGTSPALIGLEGALRAPTMVPTVFPDPPASDAFQQELEEVINLGETTEANMTEDPIVTMPFYGKNHAKQHPTDPLPLDITKNGWPHALNKDPRTRAAAGFGTNVIQENQETYMKKAWQQVEKINEANRKLRETRSAIAVSINYFQALYSRLDSVSLLALTRPLLPKVMGSPTTLQYQVKESRLPLTVFSGAFRRMMRPMGPLAKRFSFDRKPYTQVVNGINEGTLTAAPPKKTPAALPTTKDVADAMRPKGFFAWLAESGWMVLIILLLLLLITALFTPYWIAALIVAVLVTVVAVPAILRARKRRKSAQVFLEPGTAGTMIDTIEARPEFNVGLTNEPVTPSPTSGGTNGDSKEAQNFRTAVKGLAEIMSVPQPAVQVKTAFDLQNAQQKMTGAITPRVSYGRRLSYLVSIPGIIWMNTEEEIVDAMAYPDFEEPMYKKLSEKSSELLLPNLKLIPANTISLLETNQKFIESYMVGLNHEMGRELLWREYPTDQRGSYFRQFWDVSGIVQPSTGLTPEEMIEATKDIKPIHTWQKTTLLGSHNNRDAEGDDSQLVLVIRGDLLKRYPNSVIFAQKAINSHGAQRINLNLTAETFATQVKFPLYKAEIYPDIKFFGFDLTIEQARGTEASPGFPASDKEGWFFIIQEVPGEPRFGMDIEYDAGSDGVSWDDLSWKNFTTPDPAFIRLNDKPTGIPFPDAGTVNEWGIHAAGMANILYQKPSMVAVHAKEMLASL